MRRKQGDRPAWLNTDNSYSLLVPVPYQEGDRQETLTRLRLRRLNAGDLMLLDQDLPFTEKLLRIIENMSGWPRLVTVKIDAVDLDRIDDIFGYFREPGSVTGGTSSAS